MKKILWLNYEPRVHIPILPGTDAYIDFICEDIAFKKRDLRTFLKIGYYFYKKIKTLGETWINLKTWLLQPDISYRAYVVDGDGRILPNIYDLKKYTQASSLCFRLQDVLDAKTLKAGATFILVASRGRIDRWSSSPGNLSVKYVSSGRLCGYRTGFFARPLNAKKGHFGFTGINPKLTISAEIGSQLLLINHSSKPDYSETVSPMVKVYNGTGDYIEAPFGEIPPHTYRLVDVEKILPQVAQFIKNNTENICSITEVKGTTLASVHILYDKKTGSMAMDHSRPSHATVIDYLD